MSLLEKTNSALYYIEKCVSEHGNAGFLGHSGGKDSIVIHHLAQLMIDHQSLVIVHNVKPLLGTSGDPIAELTEMHPETLDFLYASVCVNNEINFLHSSMMQQWIIDHAVKYQIDGARKAEYDRPGKSSNIIRNGKDVNRSEMNWYEPDGIFGLAIVYPIFDWSDQDVWDYIITNKLAFSEEYLKNGEYEKYSNSSTAC